MEEKSKATKIVLKKMKLREIQAEKERQQLLTALLETTRQRDSLSFRRTEMRQTSFDNTHMLQKVIDDSQVHWSEGEKLLAKASTDLLELSANWPALEQNIAAILKDIQAAQLAGRAIFTNMHMLVPKNDDQTNKVDPQKKTDTE